MFIFTLTIINYLIETGVAFHKISTLTSIFSKMIFTLIKYESSF